MQIVISACKRARSRIGSETDRKRLGNGSETARRRLGNGTETARRRLEDGTVMGGSEGEAGPARIVFRRNGQNNIVEKTAYANKQHFHCQRRFPFSPRHSPWHISPLSATCRASDASTVFEVSKVPLTSPSQFPYPPPLSRTT